MCIIGKVHEKNDDKHDQLTSRRVHQASKIAFHFLAVCFTDPKFSTYVCVYLSNTPFKVSKGANIRNRYNQVPHLTQVKS